MLLKLKKNKKGFTLIELIVVVAIIAILAAIAVPTFIGMQARAQRGVDVADATTIAGAINVANASAPGTVANYALGSFNDAAYATIPDTLKPTFSSGTPSAAALGRVQVVAGVATVNASIS